MTSYDKPFLEDVQDFMDIRGFESRLVRLVNIGRTYIDTQKSQVSELQRSGQGIRMKEANPLNRSPTFIVGDTARDASQSTKALAESYISREGYRAPCHSRTRWVNSLVLISELTSYDHRLHGSTLGTAQSQ